MNKMRGIFSILFLLALCSPARSAGTHEITKWRNNRIGSVSITFDDGYVSQATTAKDLLNARNLKGTFFLWTNKYGLNWDSWRSVAAQGHEIGSHSITHSYLTQLSEQELRQDLAQSQAIINFNIPTQSCLSFSYPNNDSNEFVWTITSEYYRAARGLGSPESPRGINIYPGGSYPPIDFSNIRSITIDNASIGLMTSYIDSAEQNNAWLCVHVHDLKDPEKIGRFSQFLDMLLVRDIWVDTFGTISRYMQERISSTLAVLSEDSSEITLNLSNSLDNLIYSVPLTIRSIVPYSWSEVLVTQGSSEYLIEPVMENGEPVVYYSAIPNGGTISLLAKGASTPPRVSLDPASLSASEIVGSDALPQTFSVWNSGGGTLSYAISVDQGWLSCLPVSGTSTGEQDAITVNFSTASLFPGVYTATITISDPIASNSPQTISVTLTVASIPQATISLDPASLSASTVVGSDAQAQTFSVWNSGGGTLNYSISADQGWLSCSPVSGSSTGEQDAMAVGYSTASLASGTYTATITISDSDASNSSQTIPVILTITGIPQASMELNFEEGSGTAAYDTSGNNNNGTLYGGAVYITDPAVGLYALYFDGIDDRVVCSSNLSLRPDDISVSLWVKHVRDTSSSYGGIIQGAYGNGYSSGFRILDYKNKPLAQINFGDAAPARIMGAPFTLNEWTHIVLTYDHIKIKLYQNGQLVIEMPETRNINWSASASDLRIGLAQWYFNGMIDKIMIFDSVLTAQQVQQLYGDR